MTKNENVDGFSFSQGFQIAETVLYRQQYVSPIDVFVGMGWLQPVHVQEWRKGKIPYLEKVIQCNLGKISFTMKSKWYDAFVLWHMTFMTKSCGYV